MCVRLHPVAWLNSEHCALASDLLVCGLSWRKHIKISMEKKVSRYVFMCECVCKVEEVERTDDAKDLVPASVYECVCVCLCVA